MLFVIGILCLIASIFWRQEFQYTLPTKAPRDLKRVSLGDSVEINLSKNQRDIFIHFYNYDCPCSRFNIKEFQSLVRKFSDKVHFVAVLQTPDNNNKKTTERFKSKYDLGIETIVDANGTIAKELGIYSTPQAVIIKNHKIFYKGNYNKARFCLTQNTQFAKMALTALVNDEEPPIFPEIATMAYGCELPSNKSKNNIFDLF